jgi:hypothetical protein
LELLSDRDRETSQGNTTPLLKRSSVTSRRLIDRRLMWLLCSFQGPWRGDNAGLPCASAVAIFFIAAAPKASGRRSLKTQQHVWQVVKPLATSRTRSSTGPDGRAARQSGSVDMLGPVCSVTTRTRRTHLGLADQKVFQNRAVAWTGAQFVLPRKEVIQPQLPLRLPCYDFTPVTSPTFDGSLPCGLGHRLRVLLTPVV